MGQRSDAYASSVWFWLLLAGCVHYWGVWWAALPFYAIVVCCVFMAYNAHRYETRPLETRLPRPGCDYGPGGIPPGTVPTDGGIEWFDGGETAVCEVCLRKRTMNDMAFRKVPVRPEMEKKLPPGVTHEAVLYCKDDEGCAALADLVKRDPLPED